MNPDSHQTRSTSFDPRTLLAALSAGLVAGIIGVVVEISFGAMIFSGPFASYLSQGIGFLLFGAILLSAITAFRSTYPNAVALPQDGPAAIVAAISVVIGSQVVAAGKQAAPTLIATIIIASALTGITMFLLGRLKLGNFVRYIPYPVVGGFLAGTGYFLTQGGFSAMADENFSFARLPYLLQPELLVRWLPGVIFGVLLLLILRYRSHFLIIPGMLAGATVLFYIIVLMTHTSIDRAHDLNLLLGPFTTSGFWQLPDYRSIQQVDWQVIIGQLGSIATVVLISIFSLLLNLSGLEVATKEDIDLNREMQLMGVANLVASFFGSTPGYSAVSLSALGARFGARSRVIGAVVAAILFVTLFFGTSLLNYVPKFVLGGLILFLGLSFVVEWLYDAWFRLEKRDYAVIVIILVVMASVGVLEGVAIGMLFAIAAFVADYSRVEVVRHTFSGEYFRSNVERPRLQDQLLTKKGDWIYILELQGYLFFGTAYHLFDEVRQRFEQKTSTPRYIVLDFRRVSGIDVSAVIAFQKMKQLAQNHEAMLIFTTLSPRIEKQLKKEILTVQDAALWKVFGDLDHGLEWCEEQIFQTFGEVGFSPRRRGSSLKLNQLLPEVKGQSFLQGLIGEELLAPHKDTDLLERLSGYFEVQEVEKDHLVIAQGQPARGLFFVEKGQISITQEADGQAIRLRVLGEGTIIGEVGMYHHAIATASAVTTAPTTLHFMSLENLHKMEAEAPDAALLLHKFLGNLLSERLTHANKALEAAIQ